MASIGFNLATACINNLSLRSWYQFATAILAGEV